MGVYVDDQSFFCFYLSCVHLKLWKSKWRRFHTSTVTPKLCRRPRARPSTWWTVWRSGTWKRWCCGWRTDWGASVRRWTTSTLPTWSWARRWTAFWSSPPWSAGKRASVSSRGFHAASVRSSARKERRRKWMLKIEFSRALPLCPFLLSSFGFCSRTDSPGLQKHKLLFPLLIYYWKKKHIKLWGTCGITYIKHII